MKAFHSLALLVACVAVLVFGGSGGAVVGRSPVPLLASASAGQGWHQEASPVLRSKGDGPLEAPDGKVAVAGGDRSDYLIGITYDVQHCSIGLWLEDRGWQVINYCGLPGFEGEGGQPHLQPMSIAGVVHHGRLKLLIQHWHGDGQPAKTLYILDTGWQYTP